nr:hypothetical protein [Tanacetum cinerariifolium]
MKTPKTSVKPVEHPKQAKNRYVISHISAPIIEDWVSDSEDEFQVEPMPTQKSPSFVQTSKHMKTSRTSVKPVEHPKQADNLRTDNHKSRDHKHNWNRKACFVCKSLNHLIKDYEFYEKQMVQKPMWNHTIKGTKGNWVWKPKCTVLDHVSRLTSASMTLKQFDYTDALSRSNSVIGCSRHITGNISYLSDFEEINGGYVAFGGNPKGGKITSKGIKREFSVARTLQQNRVAERKNRTLIEAARNILACSLLPILFWAEAVNTACYVQNRVLVTKPHNKTPYELLLGRTPSIGFIRPSGCPVTIFNTLDPLGKFDRKADEGFLVGYSVTSKAFRVFNIRTRIVQETLHIHFLENQSNVVGIGPKWLFDIDTLTQSMNYQPFIAGNQPNHNAGIQGNFDVDIDVAFDVKENENEVHVSPSSDKPKKHGEKAKREAKGKSLVDLSTGVRDLRDEFEEFSVNSTNRVNIASAPVTAVRPNLTNSTNSFNVVSPSDNVVSLNFEIGEKSSFVDPSQYLDDPDMPALEDIVYLDDKEDVAPRIRSMARMVKEQDLPKGKRAIGSKWVFRNKKDERGIVIRNKARLVAHGHTQEEGIDYEQVFAPLARIEAIWLFLAYASFMGFEDPDYPDKVYKVVKALYGLHQVPRAWYGTLANYLLENGFQRGKIDQTLFIKKQKVKQKDDGIFISQDKYVAKILRKFGLTDGKLASTPIDTKKPLLKNPNGEDVDVHIYRYLKGKPHLGLWYPKDSPFNLVAYSDSDYARASLDWKSTTEGCQFLGCRLISWQCKKQIVVATSSTEAEYIDAASCCAQYALMVNPPIYVSCIKQFWASVSVKKTNDVVKLQALIDRKKVVVTEDTIQQDLRLDNVDGLECLPNEEIFTELAQGKEIREEEEIKAFWIKEVKEGRMKEDVTAVKEINVAEPKPTVFDDEEVTMTMAQTLIKMKAEKARILDEQLAKRLQDEEIEQAAAREKQEKKDLERAKVQTFIKFDRDEEPAKKRGAEETLLQESFKKQRAKVEASVAELKVEALQVKYLIIDWEIYSEGSRTYWKIIRVGGITQANQSFEEKVYPLTDAVLLLMLSTKLQIDEDCEMARDLVMKIFMEANKPKSKRSLDTSS